MDHFELGLLLMAVGMATVFAILLLVIGLGKGLLYLVNRYAPEEPVASKAVLGRLAGTAPSPLSASAAAAIVGAISALTGGKGRVSRIEKE